MLNLRKIFLPLAALSLVSATFLTIVLLYLTVSGPLDSTKKVIIHKGISTNKIAKILSENNVIRYPKLFSAVSKIYGLTGRHLKSGEYAFTRHTSTMQVLSTLVSGKSVIHKFTIVPGTTIHEAIERLKEDPLLIGEVDEGLTEGFLMPSTYFYCFGDSRQKLVSHMKQLMSETLDELMPNLSPNSPLKTRLDVLILASIVEKEAMLENEKPIIAGVFINRLKKRMKLQADPTTIYAITMGKSKLDRKISKKDLMTASPYNTYFAFGLPPSPIACPSRKSIEAVIKPANTDALYFVVNGTGGHNFSKDLRSHNNHVESYRKVTGSDTKTTDKID